MGAIAIISVMHLESSLCLAKHLAIQGVHVDFYCVNPSFCNHCLPGFEYETDSKWGLHEFEASEIPEISDYTKGLPIRFFLIGLDLSRRYAYLQIDTLFLWSACRYIKKQQYDAINIVGQMACVNKLHCFLKGENIVHTIHEIGSNADDTNVSKVVQSVISDRTKVIFHSRAIYNRFVQLAGSERILSNVIPFGRFETVGLYIKDKQIELPFSGDKPIFLFYGMLRPYKGLDLLKESLTYLDDLIDEFNLVIAGSGDDASLPFFKELKNCHVINRFLSNDEMMNLVKTSTMVVLPYHKASQTGIIPTCAIYNKPVIATNVGAFSENINNGLNGLLVPKENPREFADAMRTIITHPNVVIKLTEGMSNYGVNDSFDWNIIATQTIKFLYS